MKDAKDRVTHELPMVDVPRPGRRRTSPLSPREQNAAAQSARRNRMAGAGYSWRGFWLDSAALTALADLKTTLGCSSQDEALQRLLALSTTAVVRALLDPHAGGADQKHLSF